MKLKNETKKIVAAVVGFTMVATMLIGPVAGIAQAQSLRDLVELFISLGIIPPDRAAQARLAVSGVTGTMTTSLRADLGIPATFSFNRNLTVGSTGIDVL